jgi:GNAT superfamily N-acetyltransferase
MRHFLPSGQAVEITTIEQRPQYKGAEIDVGGWSEFMRHNRISEAYFWQTLEVFPATCLVATAEDGSVVADAQAVQLKLDGQLPAGGWERAVVLAFADVRRGVAPDVACALNISVARSFQRQGLARLMLTVLREVAAGSGLTGLIAPTSWVVAGTLAEWRAWTGLPFERTGDVVVPGALAPVHCDVGADHAVYVEPNVWVRHPSTLGECVPVPH